MGFSEGAYSTRNAHWHAETDHHELVVPGDMIDQLPALVAIATRRSPSPPTFRPSPGARGGEGVKMCCGEGSDECWAAIQARVQRFAEPWQRVQASSALVAPLARALPYRCRAGQRHEPQHRGLARALPRWFGACSRRERETLRCCAATARPFAAAASVRAPTPTPRRCDGFFIATDSGATTCWSAATA